MMQPDFAGPTSGSKVLRTHLVDIEQHQRCTAFHCSGQCRIVSQPEIIAEPDNGRGRGFCLGQA